MPFQTTAGVRYYHFENLGDGLIQAVFTRHGGDSPEPWASLNLGGTVGDAPERVRANRQRALAALGRGLESVYDVWQVHGTRVAIAVVPHSLDAEHLKADIILSDTPGLTLMMRFADCVPILLHDPVRKVIGIAHAGWLGSVKRIPRLAVAAMQACFGSKPADIRAAIGPSIGPDHYQVGPDVVMQTRQAFGRDASSLLGERSGTVMLDLWAANRLTLEQAGVRQIEMANICTACHTEDWFSHRAEHGRTGRFAAIIALNS